MNNINRKNVSSPSIILFLYSNQVKNCDFFNSAKNITNLSIIVWVLLYNSSMKTDGYLIYIQINGEKLIHILRMTSQNMQT